MKREILFRAKNFFGEWVYGSLITLDNGRKYVVPNNYFELDGHHLRCDSDYPVFVDENTIGQYVGMDNIEGNRIFENDIVKTRDEIGYVKFNKSKAIYEIVTDDWDLPFDEVGSEIEIIGNVYDNGDLLEG